MSIDKDDMVIGSVDFGTSKDSKIKFDNDKNNEKTSISNNKDLNKETDANINKNVELIGNKENKQNKVIEESKNIKKENKLINKNPISNSDSNNVVLQTFDKLIIDKLMHSN